VCLVPETAEEREPVKLLCTMHMYSWCFGSTFGKLSAVTTMSFAQVDVFGADPLSGNPLAVVLDADPLSDRVMGGVAREFNQSETTFVLAGAAAGVTRRLRSFTASGDEVTGAGHNALGAWWWLAESGRIGTGSFTQKLGGAVLDIEIHRDAGRLQVAMRQGPGRVVGEIASLSLAGPLGLEPSALAAEPARVVSTGVAHLLVAARDRAIVDTAHPDPSALLQVLHDAGAQGCYLYAAGPAEIAYARFFNPTVGLWEDAATGSAAGPLAWLMSAGGSTQLTVEQGHAIGRPSRLRLTVEDGNVTLLGSAALFAEGQIHVSDGGDW
jgi:PhzF family phenazine biosynthesis protein